MLDDMRAEFARFIADDPQARFRIDAALAHVVTRAYQQGFADGNADNRIEDWNNHDNG